MSFGCVALICIRQFRRRLAPQHDYSVYQIVEQSQLAVGPTLSLSIPILVFDVHGLPANSHSQFVRCDFDTHIELGEPTNDDVKKVSRPA